MSSSLNANQSRAAARLVKDLKEVSQRGHELTSIAAHPLESNIFEWHANLFDESGAALHLVMTFPHTYPAEPPSLTVCTPYPHMNIVLDGRLTLCALHLPCSCGSHARHPLSLAATMQPCPDDQHRSTLGTSGLDMLETPQASAKPTPYSGWSSAMSVHSILLQLDALLTDERLMSDGGWGMHVPIHRAIEEMHRFSCTGCCHSGLAAWPPVQDPTSDMPHATRMVCRPCGTIALQPATSVAATSSSGHSIGASGSSQPTRLASPRPSLSATLISETPRPNASLAPPSMAPPSAPPAETTIKRKSWETDKIANDREQQEHIAWLKATEQAAAEREGAEKALRAAAAKAAADEAAADAAAAAAAAVATEKAVQQAVLVANKVATEAAMAAAAAINPAKKVTAAAAARAEAAKLKRKVAANPFGLLDSMPHLAAPSAPSPAEVAAKAAAEKAEAQVVKVDAAREHAAAAKAVAKAKAKVAKKARAKAKAAGQLVTSRVGCSHSMAPCAAPIETRASAQEVLVNDGVGAAASTAAGTETHPPALVALVTTSESTAEGAVSEANAGCFALLDFGTLITLMERLAGERDVRALSCTCRHLATIGEDGLLWRSLFAKHYPRSALCASSLSEWKFACMLELSSNADQLTCYHTKETVGAVDEQRGRCEIFGIPLHFTANPRTHEVDYVYSTFETLAYSAFADDGVRRTVWGETFSHFLPMYIDAAHFESALPVLARTLRDMASTAAATSFASSKAATSKDCRSRKATVPALPHPSQSVPVLALDILPKLLCTTVVLLADKGVAASDRLLDGYVQVYRLLLALGQRHRTMRDQVTSRLQRFIKYEGARTKAAEPSMGVFVPLLALADGVRWSELAWPLLAESFDRGVLWACRDHPELATDGGCSLEQRLQWSWEGRRVSCRLLAFHYGFLARLAKVTVQDLDAFSGSPTPWLRAEMRSHMAKVLAADSWPAFFSLINVPLPSKAQLDGMLRQAVRNSEIKGYHTRGMDFSRVQRSGVSTILRKGESVSASATMRRIRLQEVWRWRDHQTIYLDASCLSYGFDGKPLTVVDYINTRSVSGVSESGLNGVYGRGGSCAIQHSGDVIRQDRSEGSHTVNVDLDRLSHKVAALYITLSGYTTPLASIIRPEVRCFDPDDSSGEPLTRYELEGKPTSTNTAVLMARIWRASPGSRWSVTAIGELGMGCASNYTPIRQTIERWQRKHLPSLYAADLPDTESAA